MGHTVRDYLNSLARNEDPPEPVEIMGELNPNALVAREDDYWVFIEDSWDSDTDRRMYRLEYRCSEDAGRTVAICRHNPWSNGNDPRAGARGGHVMSSGVICIARGAHTIDVSRSSVDLRTAVQRARYWCTAFSVLKESGEFPDH